MNYTVNGKMYYVNGSISNSNASSDWASIFKIKVITPKKYLRGLRKIPAKGCFWGDSQ